jgi:hypothetical protein
MKQATSKSRLAAILLLKELPIVASLALAGAGWTVVRIVDSFKDAPSVEFHTVSARTSPTEVIHTTTLINLSKTKLYTGFNIVIEVSHKSGGQLASPKLIPFLPAREIGGPGPQLQGDRMVEFPIRSLQPESKYELQVTESGQCSGAPVEVSFVSAPQSQRGSPRDEAVGSNDPIRLVPRSFETMIVRYEIFLLLVLLSGWLLIFGMSLTFSLRKQLSSRTLDRS